MSSPFARDIMVDIETLGTRPGSIILSIGAVAFTPGEGLGAAFHQIINTDSCRVAGLTEDPATVKWWDDQSPEAQRTRTEAGTAPNRLPDALAAFEEFCREHAEEGDLRLWGNGSDFDNVLIIAAYEACQSKPPWRFYNSRCYRTLKNLAPAIRLHRTGTHHNALDDARSQAEHACRLLTALNTAVAA